MPVIYKCPGCGAAMEFDSTTQKMGCPSCGMQIDVKEYERMYNNDAFGASQAVQTEKTNTEDMKIYHCSSCGAERHYSGGETRREFRRLGDVHYSSAVRYML